MSVVQVYTTDHSLHTHITHHPSSISFTLTPL